MFLHLSRSPVLEATSAEGLDAGLAVAARIRASILSQVTPEMLTNAPLFIARVRQLVSEAEPVLERALTDAALLSWLRGGASAAVLAPPQPRRGPEPASGFPGGGVRLPAIEAAAADLMRRRLITSGDLAAAEADIEQQVFSVAAVATQASVSLVREVLEEALTQGMTLEEFKDRLRQDLETSSLGPARVEAIFRTQLAIQRTRGLSQTVQAPLVRSEFPFVETLPILDSRLTELCRVISESGIDGTGVFHIEDPVWKKFAPPRHWQCRCGTRLLTLEMAADRGIEWAQQYLDSGVAPVALPFVPWPAVELPKDWVSPWAA